MNKHLKKSIMSRSRLRNKFLKEKTEENRKNYKKNEKLLCTSGEEN